MALALGSVAGVGAARVAASHYSLMVRGTSQIFTAGPPLVAYLGQQVTKEELGGAAIHARNGTVNDSVRSEEEAFLRVRTFLSYLPRSTDECRRVHRAPIRSTAAKSPSLTRSRAPSARSTRFGRSSRPSPIATASSRSGVSGAARW